MFIFVFFFKQKTAYEMRISDWSSDVCSSDLHARRRRVAAEALGVGDVGAEVRRPVVVDLDFAVQEERLVAVAGFIRRGGVEVVHAAAVGGRHVEVFVGTAALDRVEEVDRSEEHTSELQSLMRISYAVFCLKKKKN